MISYILNKDLNGEKILNDIQKMMVKFRTDSPDKIPILYIDIRCVTHDDTSLIPKLEHKILDGECST